MANLGAKGPGMEGSVIGNYRVVRKLTEGGMGTVYEAVHDRLGKRAALKTLHPEFARRPEFVQRLIDEARAVSLVDHPGLVEVFDCGLDENGTAYILMEYLNGETLGARLKAIHGRGRLDFSVTLRIARQIASALAATHEKGIVHRDLKPDNVMLVADPESPGGERAKLLDFGIAKLRAELTESEDTRHVTMAGTLMGTPTFMSPEQCRGAGHVDDRTDVYSLGIMLYLMVGGRPPFVADGPGEVMLMHMTQQPAPLSTLSPDAPLELLTLVHQMLQKERSERPSMQEVSLRLSQLCEALDWAGTTGAYVKLSGAPSAMGPASSRAQPVLRPGPGLHPAASGAAYAVPSQVGSLPVPGRTPTGLHPPLPASSETSFSRGSLHPLGYSTGSHPAHSPGSRRRWFVGVAIVTGFVVAAPLWWLIDQREQAEQSERERALVPDPPPAPSGETRRRESPSTEGSLGQHPAASAPAAPAPEPPAVPTETAEAAAPAGAEPARTPTEDAPSPAKGRASTKPSSDEGDGGERSSARSRGERASAEAAEAGSKTARSTRRGGGKKSEGDELLNLLDQRPQPSDSRSPAAEKAKPRAASPTRANAKEKAHVDPSLF
jgi:serine/threonine-protein kinase